MHTPGEASAPLMQRIGERLEILTQATTLPAIWKVGSAVHVTLELPAKHHMHTCEFCAAVKNAGTEFQNRCIHNDEVIIAAAAVAKRAPFLHRCHAGADELVIPIFHGDSYIATILLGPFRSQATEAVPAPAQAAFARLPESSPERSQALTQLAELLFAGFTAELHDDITSHLLPSEARISDERISAGIEYLRRNFRRQPHIEQAARKCALSISHFQHLFKRTTALAFREYLQRIRIIEAERLLRWTTLPVSEIATACGLCDQSRLAALFQRYYHVSPSAYRHRFRQNMLPVSISAAIHEKKTKKV